MYKNADYQNLKEHLQYAFDKAHLVVPSNAQAFNNYAEDKDNVLIEEITLNRFYLLKLIRQCNPSFDYVKNLKRIKEICEDWQFNGEMDYRLTWDNARIDEITFTPNQLITFLYFVKGNGIQTNLF